MTPTTVRRAVLAVCAAGIAGMIVSSIAGSTGGAVTFGLLTTVAVLCLLVTTAVAGPAAFRAAPVDEEQAARVEGLAQELITGGADEPVVRSLVREAVRLGRRRAVAAPWGGEPAGIGASGAQERRE